MFGGVSKKNKLSGRSSNILHDMDLGKIVCKRESSECSQFDDPDKNSGLEIDNQDSKVKLHRKKKHRDPVVQVSNDNPSYLRSLKNVDVIGQRRRSMRLISKALVPACFNEPKVEE